MGDIDTEGWALNDSVLTNNQYCKAIMTPKAGGSTIDIGLMVSMNGSGGGYCAIVYRDPASGGATDLTLFIFPAWTELKGVEIPLMVDGDELYIENVDNWITVKINRITKIRVRDFTYKSGKAGIYSWGQAAVGDGYFDNFECGNIADQRIEVKRWTGTGDLWTTYPTRTDYGPHKFTFSKTGYQSLVLENIDLTGPTRWVVELQPHGGTGAQSRLISMGVM
jgi:hypothetical protein